MFFVRAKYALLIRIDNIRINSDSLGNLRYPSQLSHLDSVLRVFDRVTNCLLYTPNWRGYTP